jgi:hypothetical protein
MRQLLNDWRLWSATERLKEQKQEKKVVPEFVKDWADSVGAKLLPLSGDIRGFLGSGAQGQVYSATIPSMGKGKEFAVKFSDPFGKMVDEERAMLEKIKKIQQADKIIKRHTVNIYDIQEIQVTMNNPYEPGEVEVPVYVYIVERLNPLSKDEEAYFNNLNITRTKFLNNVFFNKGWRGWNKVRKIFTDNLLPFFNGLDKEFPQAGDVLSGKRSALEKLLTDSFDKARDNLSKEELEMAGVFVDLFDSPSIVHKKNLSELYADKMLSTPEGSRMVEIIRSSAKGDISEEILLKKINKSLYETLLTSFDNIFHIVIPLAYSDPDFEGELGSFSLQRESPMKSLNQAMLRLQKKYGIAGRDIHEKNVMKRGDDLVISDLGFFANL